MAAPNVISTEPSAQSLSISDFLIIKLIGQGFCGKVFLATDLRTNKQVALKVIPKTKNLSKWAVMEQAIQASLESEDPTFLLPLLCSWHDTMNFYLVTEYLGGNDMAVELGSSIRFTEGRTRFYAAEMIVALEQLYARGIIHRDIKPGNIMFTKDGHIRLTDFGLSTRVNFTTNNPSQIGVDHMVSEVVGTPAYMSIEAHLGQPYSFDVDVHALGVVTYQMLTGKVPFGERAVTAQQLQNAILDGSFEFDPADDVSKVAQDFICKLLVKKPCDLISLDEMKRHHFFKGVKWDRVRKQTLAAPWKPSIPSLPVSPPKCFVAHGKPYEFSDPYPEFCFLSPRFYCPKANRVDVFHKVKAFFKSTSGIKIGFSELSLKPLSLGETPPPTSSPKLPILPRAPISSSPTELSTGGLSNSIPVKLHWPSNSVLIIPLPAISLLNRPTSNQIKSVSNSPRQASTFDPRGRLPRPLIRKYLRNRPRTSTTPRPPFINIFYSTDSLADDSNPSARNVLESQATTPQHKLSNTPIKGSPLRNVTNSSDCLRPSSAAAMPRRATPLTKPPSNIEVGSENRSSIIVKPAIKFASMAITSNTIPTLHIPTTPTPIRKLSLDSLLPSISKPMNLEAEVDQSRTITTEVKNDLDARFKTTISKIRRSKASTLGLDDDDLLFRCRGDPEAAETSAISSTSQSTSYHTTTEEGPESQAVTNTPSSNASDACISQAMDPADCNNVAPGIYPRALERAETYTHPALAYAHTKKKPEDYPRPVFKPDVDLKPWYPSIEEAFALPPRDPPKPPKFPRRLVLPDILTIRAAAASSSPLSSPPPPPPSPPSPTPSRKLFDSDSPTLSAEGRSWLYYGHSSPALKISGEDFKAHVSDTIAQARRDVYTHAESGVFPSARQHGNAKRFADPEPILSGRHYVGSSLPSSRSGPLVLLRRYYIRLLMACGRLMSCSNGFRTLNAV